MLITIVITAICLDRFWGEPARFHPLVGFGNIANYWEKTCNLGNYRVLKGGLSFVLLVAPPTLIVYNLSTAISNSVWVSWSVNSLILYWAIGHHSLKDHVNAVERALLANDLASAREKLSYIVSRDTGRLNETQVTQASIETTLENGSDAVFAPLFWFCLLGAPAVVAYRLVNTLDAMWGYRTSRFDAFGKVSALADDALNYFPARAVALTYALLGNAKLGFKCWREQARLLQSPNAGPVMTAGAGSLALQLGGPAQYNGRYSDKPVFGGTRQPNPKDIQRSLALVQNTLVIWCLLILTYPLTTWVSLIWQ